MQSPISSPDIMDPRYNHLRLPASSSELLIEFWRKLIQFNYTSLKPSLNRKCFRAKKKSVLFQLRAFFYNLLNHFP